MIPVRKSVLLIIVWLAPQVAGANSGEQATAWEVLIEERPRQFSGIAPIEKEALQSMSLEAAEILLAGAPADSVFLLNGESLQSFLERKGQIVFDLTWHTFDNGAERVGGGSFVLTGLWGQPEVGVVSKSSFVLKGGFFAHSRDEIEGIIFRNGFEAGNTQEWSNATN